MAYEMLYVKSFSHFRKLQTGNLDCGGEYKGGGPMSTFWKQLISDECGALLVSDWVFLATILVIAVIPSMYGLRNKTAGRGNEEFQSKKPAVLIRSNR
jgi:hypothetical protein